jgi:diacylglycerol kinase (ATP)
VRVLDRLKEDHGGEAANTPTARAASLMQIDVIVHSNDAAALEQLREAVRGLRERGYQVQGRVTFEAGDAERFAREATVRGADLILAAGGDGTLNEVLNGILADEPLRQADQLPKMGMIPLGTANDLASWLEVPGNVADAVAASLTEDPRTIDVGRMNGRYFLNVSTGGFGAEATEEAPERAKRALGSFAYVITGVRKFAELQPSRARFTSNGEEIFEGEFLLYAVGNGCRTGGGNYLTPRATLDDGLLDVAIVRAVSHADFLRLLPQLRTGAHVESDHVVYRQVPHLLVEPEAELSVNADGEAVDARQFEYSIVAGALRLATPHPHPA